MGAADEDGHRPLSPQELACLKQLAVGRTNKEIARELGLSPATVATYLKCLFQKLGVDNRCHAVAVALRRGLIDGH